MVAIQEKREFVRHPLEKACCDMIEALTARVKETDNPYAATQAGTAAAQIVKQLRKAGAFQVSTIRGVGEADE